MKYFLLNKQEIKDNIWTNPILVKTKCLSKIKKLKSLRKKLDQLQKQVIKDLYDNNSGLNSEIIESFLTLENNTELNSKEFNSLKVMCLLDTQEQRMRVCNKTEVLKGKLYENKLSRNKKPRCLHPQTRKRTIRQDGKSRLYPAKGQSYNFSLRTYK